MSTAQIVFFLMGAMTIVEVVDAHNGFDVITKRIATRKAVVADVAGRLSSPSS
jgi:Na+/H+ antiporter NhaD/arsenite permease-like protein